MLATIKFCMQKVKEKSLSQVWLQGIWENIFSIGKKCAGASKVFHFQISKYVSTPHARVLVSRHWHRLLCLTPHKCVLVLLNTQAPHYGFGGLTRPAPACLPLLICSHPSLQWTPAMLSRLLSLKCANLVPASGSFLAPLPENIQMCVQSPPAFCPELDW